MNYTDQTPSISVKDLGTVRPLTLEVANLCNDTTLIGFIHVWHMKTLFLGKGRNDSDKKIQSIPGDKTIPHIFFIHTEGQLKEPLSCDEDAKQKFCEQL